MRKTFSVLALMFLISIVYLSCYYDSAEELYPIINNKCDTTNVTYTTTISSIISDNCGGCHISQIQSGASSLSGYTNVKNNINSIYNDVAQIPGTSFNAMPKGSLQLDNCKINLIRLWKSKGCPQ